MLAMLVSVWLAPAAHAQLGGGLGDVVGSLDDATGSVGDPVGGITDGLEGNSSGSGADSEPSSGSGGETNGGGLMGAVVGGTIDAVEKTVESGKQGLEEVVDETGNTLGNAGSDTVGGIVATVEKTVVDVTGKNKKQRKAGSEEPTNTGTTTTSTPNVLGKSLADALQADGRLVTAAALDGRGFSVVPVSDPADESLITRIGKIATETIQHAAFPLALTLLVIGFLMMQNRFDRKDPKLALAPVDSEHDLLSFT
jgi:hypothetical protein